MIDGMKVILLTDIGIRLEEMEIRLVCLWVRTIAFGIAILPLHALPYPRIPVGKSKMVLYIAILLHIVNDFLEGIVDPEH